MLLIALILIILIVIWYFYNQSRYWNICNSINKPDAPIYFIKKYGWRVLIRDWDMTNV